MKLTFLYVNEIPSLSNVFENVRAHHLPFGFTYFFCHAEIFNFYVTKITNLSPYFTSDYYVMFTNFSPFPKTYSLSLSIFEGFGPGPLMDTKIVDTQDPDRKKLHSICISPMQSSYTL